jgi:diadenosine tetraphosphate (Ap4A) HIT family hydrolase
MKLLETETVFAFMDIGPIAKGHCLVIPKCKLVLARVGHFTLWLRIMDLLDG